MKLKKLNPQKIDAIFYLTKYHCQHACPSILLSNLAGRVRRDTCYPIEDRLPYNQIHSDFRDRILELWGN